ncbi:MAG: hypothetical protein EXR23_04400 [Flavobacteriaceae bacterium]|nr:hypothetical protein [Flavobacteriaceae bacterium]PHX77013.1 MAG: hypothetical protein CK543_04340 [Flavobacteriales bacterium]
MLLSFLLLTGAAIVLSRNHIVQNYFAQQLAQYLSKELNTKVEIGYVEIDFLRNIHVERLRIYDQSKDTLIEARQIEARLTKVDWKLHSIELSSVVAYKPRVKNGYHTEEGPLNIDFFSDYLNPPSDPNDHSEGWDFGINDAKIVDGYYQFFNIRQTSNDPYFDPDNLVLSNIDAEMDSLTFGHPWFTVNIKSMAFKERSGLNIIKGSARVVIDKKQILASNLLLETPCSILGDRFEMRYNSMRDFRDIFHKVTFDIRLSKSKFCLEELLAFHPWFKDRNLPLFVNAHALGPLDALVLKKFTFESLTDQTQLKGSGILTSLQDLDNFEYRLELDDSRLALADLQDVVYELDSIDFVKKFEALDIGATITGGLTSFGFDGDLDAGPGHFSGHLALDFPESIDSMSYDVEGKLGQWDLGMFAGNGLDAFVNDANILITGEGLTADLLNTEADIHLIDYTVFGRHLTDIQLTGEFDKSQFHLNVESDDARFAFVVDATVFDWDKNLSMDADLSASNVEFENIGLDKMPLILSGSASLIYGGGDAENTNATIEVRQLVADHGTVRYFCNSQQLIQSASRGIRFSGDWLNGSISAGFDPSDAMNIGEHFLYTLLPNRFDAPKLFVPADFNFDLQLIQTDWLSSFVDKTLQSGPINLVGNFGSQHRDVDVVLGPMDLTWQGAEWHRLKLVVNSNTDGAATLLLNAKDLNYGETKYDRFALEGKLTDGILDVGFDLHDMQDRYNVNLGALSNVKLDSLPTNINAANFYINKEPWQLDEESQLSLVRGNKVKVKNFMVNNSEHFVELHGVLSEMLSDTFTVEVGNITPELLSPFFPNGTFDSLQFHLGGRVRVAAALGQAKIVGESYLNDLVYLGYRYGSFDLKVGQRTLDKVLDLDLVSRRGVLKNTSFRGKFKFGGAEPSLDADLYIPEGTTFGILTPFLSGIATTESGTIGGNVRIEGPMKDLIMQGDLKARDVTMGVDYLGTKYRFDEADFLVKSNGIFTRYPIQVFGKLKKGKAKATFAFTHNHFKDLALDLNVYDAQKIRIIETTEADNDLFYGTAWGNGSCRIWGPLDKINIKMDMTPTENSKLSILYPTLNTNTVAGNIIFRNHFGKVVGNSKAKKSSSGLGNIDLMIRATPDLETEFLIDKRLGDMIKGRGTGDIRILYDENERFFLNGQYTIKSGLYVFSLPGINLLTKKITLTEGGKITWVGDPYDANLALSGKIEKRISPAQLMVGSGNASGTNYPPTLIVSVLNINGSLMKPQIGFDLQAPELAVSAGSNSDVNAVIQRIRQDKDETMRQAIALLIFGNFLPPSFSSGNPTSGNVVSGVGVAGNSVSNIASSVVNDIFQKYGIKTKIQVNIDDVRRNSGTSNTQVFVNSEWNLSDRLKLNLNYDPTVAVLVSSIAVPLNFNLEYSTRNENWRLKMFSRSNNLLLQQSGSITNGVSGNTLGGGALYRREFETFRRKTRPITNTTEEKPVE